jgi:hypothetical protein
MNLIEKLGLEKCKQIVERHRNLGTHFSKFIYFSEKYDDFFTVKWVSRIGDFINIEDLRAAIADHERTDYVSDIANHISPLTKVIER